MYQQLLHRWLQLRGSERPATWTHKHSTPVNSW
jgi:hypothetical protein